MSDESFADYVARERDRIVGSRRWCERAIAEYEEALAKLAKEEEAVDAYERAKSGRETIAPPTKQRTRPGSSRRVIVNAVSAAPNGMSRGELIGFFGVKGDKSGEMSVSNALTALTKRRELIRVGGRYHLNPENGNEAESAAAMQRTLNEAEWTALSEQAAAE
jgi:hypothetical protein